MGVLDALAAALRAGRLQPPFGAAALGRFVPGADSDGVARELTRLAGNGMAPAHIAYVLDQIGAVRREAGGRDRLELVWTGPEVAGARSRDTGVVVRELFASAERSVLVATYAVYQGRQVLRPLADRMAALPQLRVQLFLHIGPPRSPAPEAETVRRFVADFVAEHWPGGRLPELYYDPRTLATPAGGPRASLHAKCIVVDDRRTFITSANFTEAAQERNIEAGVLVDDPGFALTLRQQFESLVARGILSVACT